MTSISSFLPTVTKKIDVSKNKKEHVESNFLPKFNLVSEISVVSDNSYWSSEIQKAIDDERNSLSP